MASENDEVCENYLFLTPREATFGDVFRFILSSGSAKIKNLINCPKGKEESYTNFKARSNIFVSIVVLKILIALFEILPKFCSKLMRALSTIVFNTANTIPPSSPLPQPQDPLQNLHDDNNTVPGDGELWGAFESNLSANFIPEASWDVDELSDSNCDNLDVNDDDSKPKENYEGWEIMNLYDTKKLYDNDFRYYGALTVMASKLAYSDSSWVKSVVNNYWQMNFLRYSHFLNDEKETSHAFLFQSDPNVTVVAFRGTNPLDANDWMVDLNFSWYEIKGVGNIHCGFMKALGLQMDMNEKPPKSEEDLFAYYSIRRTLRNIAAANHKAKFIITGHSLGGALAILFVAMLAIHKESGILEKVDAVYTYGQPRVGDDQFAKFMEASIKKYGLNYYRYVYSCDMVPRVPFQTSIFKYKHFGKCVYFDCFNHGQFLENQPNTNYISITWLIPKYFSAWCEFIRSLIIIPLFKGRAHFEGFETILVRFVGLLIPGLSAHICSNYVYLTRWGDIKHVSANKEPKWFAHYLKKKNIKHYVFGMSVFVLFVCSWGWSPPSFD